MKCGICSKKTENKSILKDTFTDLDSLKSHSFCDDCKKLFSSELLKTSFYIYKNETRKIKQGELAEFIFKTMKFPSKISFTKSRKKHRLFRTKISHNEKEINVETDEETIIINRKKDKDIFQFLENLYNLGVPKSELLNGIQSVNIIKKIGIENYINYKERSKKLFGSKKFKLLVDLINKKNEN